MTTRLVFVHALSPLHAGTGRTVDVIDLPIAREKATNLPYVPGSSLKGVLRDESDAPNKDMIFGTTEQSGAAIFSDQRLLLLPVRSLYGTFAWVTSPYVLRRFAREAVVAQCEPPALPDSQDTRVTQQSVLVHGQQRTVYLEDLDLPTQTGADAWADWLAERLFKPFAEWQTMLKQRLCIVPDDVLNFLLVTATDITARIKINDTTGVVEQGGLWYEEALPSESVLVGLVSINNHARKQGDAIMQSLMETTAKPIQLGGNATVGRGLCRVTIY